MFLLALLLAGAARAQQGGGTVEIELRSDVLLDHARVVLGDVARLTVADAALRQQLETLPVAGAPLVGYVGQLGRAELDLAIHGRLLAAGQRIVWSGAASVQLRRHSQTVDPERLADVASAYLQQALAQRYPGAELTLALAEKPKAVAAPAGAIEFKARPLAEAPLQARMPVWVDVLADGAVYRSVVVLLAVTARQPVALALRGMAEGDAIGPADVRFSVEEVTGLRDLAAGAAALAVAPRLRQALQAGQIVTARQLAPAGMVLRGDRVRLLAGAAAIVVEKSAYAQADAEVGQLVRVQPEQSKEIVAARVVSPGVVRMEGR